MLCRGCHNPLPVSPISLALWPRHLHLFFTITIPFSPLFSTTTRRPNNHHHLLNRHHHRPNMERKNHRDYWRSSNNYPRTFNLGFRRDLLAGAARPNPQGSYHYGSININRTLILRNDVGFINRKLCYTVNVISFLYLDTPLKLADCFQLNNVFERRTIPDMPFKRFSKKGVSVIDAMYHDYVQVIFQNPRPILQTLHADGYKFFVVGMGFGKWKESKMKPYNMVDVSRSTVQVYPMS